MDKTLLVSLDIMEHQDLIPQGDLRLNDFIDLVISSGNKIVFYSRVNSRLQKIKENNPGLNSGVRFLNRTLIKDRLTAMDYSKKSKFIVIGRKKKDFQLAVHNKLLYISPAWLSQEPDAERYGLKVDNLNQLHQFIQTINNQTSWFSSLTLDDETRIISLSDARTYDCFINSREELRVVNQFRQILKSGSRNYYEMFLYHFLSSISNNYELFYDINLWGCFPTSDGILKNNEMFYFKERVREMMFCQPLRDEAYKQHKNLIIRHTPTTKSHDMTSKEEREERKHSSYKKHFNTIHLHPSYRGKLEGKNVCIFDDYSTHGNSFEIARNLLRSAGVNKLIFISLGRFVSDYQLQNYLLEGDIYSKDYTYTLLNKKTIQKYSFSVNSSAKVEVENLHKIFNLQ